MAVDHRLPRPAAPTIMVGMSDSYEHLAALVTLANALERRLQMMDRDRVLVLAAAMASRRHMEPLAGYFRSRVLEHNGGHMLKRYETLFDALSDPDFLTFLNQVGRRYPIERVESQLAAWNETIPEPPGDLSEPDRLALIAGADPEAIRRTFDYGP